MKRGEERAPHHAIHRWPEYNTTLPGGYVLRVEDRRPVPASETAPIFSSTLRFILEREGYKVSYEVSLVLLASMKPEPAVIVLGMYRELEDRIAAAGASRINQLVREILEP